MDDKQMQKFIGYAVLAIIAYFVLEVVVPYLMIGVIAFVILQAYQEFKKLNK